MCFKKIIFFGVVLFNSIFLKAQGNIVPNGSFENLASASWISSTQVQGSYGLKYDGTELAMGTYLCVMITKDDRKSIKIEKIR